MSNDPIEKAKAGLEEAWKAARSAAGGVKKEIERAGIAKTIDDAGREIARAATSVASHLGAELEELGREIRIKAEGTGGEPPPPASAPTQGQSQGGRSQDGQSQGGQSQDGQSQGGQSQGQGQAPTGDDGTRTPRPGGVRIASD